jgi:hypothetical protein
MKLRSKAALKKLWPGKPILQALFITEKGSEIQLETLLPPAMFEEILARVANYMSDLADEDKRAKGSTNHPPGCEECGAGPGEQGDPKGPGPCGTCGNDSQ